MNDMYARSVAAALIVSLASLAACSSEVADADGVTEKAALSTTRRDDAGIGRVEFDSKGLSETIGFDVPANAVSFVVVIEGPDEHLYYVEHLETPSGKAIVSSEPGGVSISAAARRADPLVGQLRSLDRAIVPDVPLGVGTLLVPNNPKVAVAAGRWTARFGAYGPPGERKAPPAQVRVVFKLADTVATKGTLDLHLHFTGGKGLSADTAKTDPDFQAVIARVKRLYAAADIKIQVADYSDVPASFAKVNLDNVAPLMKLGTHDTGVDIVFVSSIYLPSDLAGYTGGLPGPALTPNTRGSSVIVNARDYDQRTGRDLVANTVAHEIGHYLGLFHSVEANGDADDLSDTPAGDDQDNLMHWEARGSGAISPQQKWVLLRSPAIQW